MRIELDEATGDTRWRALAGSGQASFCSGVVFQIGGGRWRASLGGSPGRTVDADGREAACRAVADALIALHAGAGRVELASPGAVGSPARRLAPFIP